MKCYWLLTDGRVREITHQKMLDMRARECSVTHLFARVWKNWIYLRKGNQGLWVKTIQAKQLLEASEEEK